MEVKDLKLSITIPEAQKYLPQRAFYQILDVKMNQVGFYKCIDLADQEGIERQSMYDRIKAHPKQYLTVQIGKFLYAKKK
jgi:hypothetical protein